MKLFEGTIQANEKKGNLKVIILEPKYNLNGNRISFVRAITHMTEQSSKTLGRPLI